MKIRALDIVLKILGLLLLAAAIMKSHELLTVPVANKDIWSWRPFLIFQVEFELVLGIWLLSGVFKRFIWILTLACFCVFCCVTLYKAITGAASCGCFGAVHVNPWITLFVVDLPAVLTLVVFRPMNIWFSIRCFNKLLIRIVCLTIRMLGRSSSHLRMVYKRAFGSLVSMHTVTLSIALLLTLCVTTPILAFNTPKKTTTSYEILEPETWVGEELPILDHIDIGEQLRMGNWLVVLYHYGCPDCTKVARVFKEIARGFNGKEGVMRIALVEVPPYNQGLRGHVSLCRYGELDQTKEWFVTTPVILLIQGGQVLRSWDAQILKYDILGQIRAGLISMTVKDLE